MSLSDDYILYQDPLKSGAYNNQPKNLNDARNTKYLFRCNRMPSVSYFAPSIILPGLEGGVATQASPLMPIPRPGHGKNIYQDLELEFIVDENYQNYWEIEDWITAINFPSSTDQYKSILTANPDASSYIGDIYSDANLFLLTNSSTPNYTVIFKHLFPVSLGELEFKADDDKPEPLKARATFKYLYRTRIKNV